MTFRTALITGASRGLGFAFATHLARTGWRLVIDARTASNLSVAAQALQDLADRPVIAIDGDVTDPQHAAALVAAAEDLGDLELLVNNASTLGPSPLPSLADFPIAGLAHVARSSESSRHDRQRDIRRCRRGLRGMGRVRVFEGRSRTALKCSCSGRARGAGAVGRPRRHEHPNASRGLSR